MEIFELKYFIGVAHRQNIHHASRELRVSPASLSKTIKRLEDELGVQLFSREGRNIRITDHGINLLRYATSIIALEESARHEIQGGLGVIHPVIAGPEVFLATVGLKVAAKIRKHNASARFEFRSTTEASALKMVSEGEAHVAIVARDVPSGLIAVEAGKTKFQTYVGGDHPLAARAVKGASIRVEEVLEHEFVCPSQPIYGNIGPFQSPDGWRDDKFPRKIGYIASSLRMIEEITGSGLAIAYLPDSHAQGLGFLKLKVTGCPYTCEQNVQLVARDPGNHGWLKRLFGV